LETEIRGDGATVRLAEVAAFVRPSLTAKTPAGTLTVFGPIVELATDTVTVQPPPGICVPLAIETVLEPVVAVTPVHVPPGAAPTIVIPAGSVLLKGVVRVRG
jgi:hypothetical protein